jgi:hypothetical protein
MTKKTSTPADILPPTADTYIENAVKSFSVTDDALKQLKASYGNLTIQGAADKEGYEAVRLALSEVRGYRTGIEATRKELNEFPLKFQRAVNAEAKRITEELLSIENPLKLQKEHADNEAERLRIEAEERKRQQYLDRTNSLFELGAAFNGSIYTLDGHMFGLEVLHVTPAEIEELEDDQWDAGYGAMVRLSEAIEAAKEAKAIADAEAAAEAAAKQAEIDAKLKRLEELEAKLAAEAAAKVEPEPTPEPEPYYTPQVEPIKFPAPNQKTVIDEAGQVKFDVPETVVKISTAELNIRPTAEFTPQSDYGKGFIACQERVIEKLDNPDKFTRAELKEFVRRLRP